MAINPSEAADNYRIARGLLEKARTELYKAVVEQRDVLNVDGIARRAGVHNSTIREWMRNEGVSKRGG